MTKAKDMFNTLFQIEELTKDEFSSIIWSNPVEDDFVSAMCALMDFFPYNSSSKKDCSNCDDISSCKKPQRPEKRCKEYKARYI